MPYRLASYEPILAAGSPQTNPTTTDVLADTGALDSALYEARIAVGCTVAALFVVQRRDSDNTNNVGDVIYIRAAAGQTGEYVFKFEINHNERIRVLPGANITGNAEATIQIERIA